MADLLADQPATGSALVPAPLPALPPPLVPTRPSIVFVGCVEEGRRSLAHLLDTGEDVRACFTLTAEKAAATSGAVRWDDLTDAAGVPLHRVTTMNDPTVVARLRDIAPDVLFCIGWTQLLGPDVLAVPRLGCIGFHASLLPRFRGRAPVNWAIINGETVTGNTMLLLDDGVDTGDILAQRAIPISPDDTCATVYDKVAASEAEMLDEVLPLLRVGIVPRRPQDHASATVVGRRRPDDGLIDWTRTTAQLHDWVRALTHPYPGAFTIVDGTRVWVWRARPLTSVGPPGLPPGGLGLVGDPAVLVAGTGDGALVIERAQRDGDSERDGVDFAERWLAGANWRAGDGIRSGG